MFKKTKLSKKEERENTFQKPVTKASREIRTHLVERTPVEKIFFCFNLHLKRKTAYRMIADLPPAEIDRNIYILTELMLKAMLEDTNIDRLFYVALQKIAKSEKVHAIEQLCMKYLIAQLNLDRKYLSFANFVLQHFRGAFLEKKEEILGILEECEFKSRIERMHQNQETKSYDLAKPIYYTR